MRDFYGGGDTLTPERPFEPTDEESGYQGNTVVDEGSDGTSGGNATVVLRMSEQPKQPEEEEEEEE